MRTKIDFGIDLGTTNSAISRMVDGKPTIKKVDGNTDTMPSCVGFNKKKVISVGSRAHNSLKNEKRQALKTWSTDLNSFIEFKRTMGTEANYQSTFMSRFYSSEELSAEVLLKLKSQVQDENLSSIVITVPAMFTQNQNDATRRSAKLAGFNQVELLQEPIAASMAYGLKPSSSDGYWLVFDFGGGTFDAALVNVEDGIMQVKDTAGDSNLGGKNIDEMVVDKIILPAMKGQNTLDSILKTEIKEKIIKSALKQYAEEAKISLSTSDSHNIAPNLGELPGVDDNGKELDLDLDVTTAQFEKVVSPIFQKAINITKELLSRWNLTGADLSSLLLVGGPTHSPVLRSMLENQICKPDTSIDPMTAVANGAALYASTVDITEDNIIRNVEKLQLDLGYESTTVNEAEFVTIKIHEGNKSDHSDDLYVELLRNDGAWTSGKQELPENGALIKAALMESKSNVFNVKIYNAQGDTLDVEPSTLNILQGLKSGDAILPYHIGIEVLNSKADRKIFLPIKGLEKNQPIPATGVSNGLKTITDIRPGMNEDRLKIAIYQGDTSAIGTRAIYNNYVSDIIITGVELPEFLPKASDIDVTLKIDKSQKMTMSLYFPSISHSIDKAVPEILSSNLNINILDENISIAYSQLNELTTSSPSSELSKINSIRSEIESIEERLNSDRSDENRKQECYANLKKELIKLDDLAASTEWPRLEKEIRAEFDRLVKVNEQFGTPATQSLVDDLRSQVDQIIRSKEAKLGEGILQEIGQVIFELTRLYQYIGFLESSDQDFASIQWKGSADRARKLINDGMQLIRTKPSVENLHPIVVELVQNHYPRDGKSPIPQQDGTLRQG